MPVSIHPVVSTRDRNDFIKFQWAIYRDDPCWVPPLLFERRKILDVRKNPFYRHAEIAMFLARRDGAIVGRIAAITNENHNRVHNDRVGFFGFFECVNDQETADALFSAAGAWLKERGKTVMRGPMNPSVNDDLGLLVDGFSTPPLVLMPHNPPYYAALCEGHGLAKAKDLYAYYVRHEKLPLDRLQRMSDLLRERFELTVRELDYGNIAAEVATLKTLYNTAWEKNWGAVAMTDEEFDVMSKDLVQVLGKRFRRFAFVVEQRGVPIGFSLTLPDINQLLIRNRNGRLLPGLFHLLTGTKSINRGRIIVLGILPEFRGKGIDALMYHEILTRGAEVNVRQAEASWILEDNVMMNRGAELLNSERYKTYRIYDIDV